MSTNYLGLTGQIKPGRNSFLHGVKTMAGTAARGAKKPNNMAAIISCVMCAIALVNTFLPVGQFFSSQRDDIRQMKLDRDAERIAVKTEKEESEKSRIKYEQKLERLTIFQRNYLTAFELLLQRVVKSESEREFYRRQLTKDLDINGASGKGTYASGDGSTAAR